MVHCLILALLLIAIAEPAERIDQQP
ncbi:hypothetical protein RS9917_12880 [Synechococcus sp. RS9917]|nr:hypothetical protein RS9917_12880 [Synechococcus sp. RS9917]